LNTPPKIARRDAARAAVWTNLALPGLGLWMTGQRALGALLIAMSASGLLLKIGWLAWFLRRWIASGQMPDPLARHLLVPVIGVTLFVTALLWAVLASLAHLRSLPPEKAAPPPRIRQPQ
jgi:hypothetical protein